MTISEDDPRQPSEQVTAKLREEIRTGAIRPGHKVGSVRDLARRFNVSPTTVQRALAALRDEGLAVTSGRGTYARDPNRVSEPVAQSADSVAILRQLEHVTSQLSELRARVDQLEADRSGSAIEDK
ncbi:MULTISPECIES: winged helix-turn-helix domain-containing protein [unclassified Streptomyces]|uniref:GntR family transcriptional regulator n=1 Tax=unclassified Streptomyces TaxID=2593676 RepID=UPI00340C4AFA